jgi:hypothetical protein
MGVLLVGIDEVDLVVDFPEWGQLLGCPLQYVFELFVPLLL